jgi:hypothetical protein
VENVLTLEQCQALRQECKRMVDDFDISQHPKTVFTTGEGQVAM